MDINTLIIVSMFVFQDALSMDCLNANATGYSDKIGYLDDDVCWTQVGDEIAYKILKEFEESVKVGKFTDKLNNMLRAPNYDAEKAGNEKIYNSWTWENLKHHKIDTCKICALVIGELLTFYKSNASANDIRSMLTSICYTSRLAKLHICEELVGKYLKTILYILENTKNITENHPIQRLCNILMQVGEKCWLEYLKPQEWSVTVPFGNKTRRREIPEPSPINESIVIIHVANIHLDPNYTIHSAGECNEPQCCSLNHGSRDKAKRPGYWGDYGSCDTPQHALDNLIKQIQITHPKADFIYLSGGFIDHAIWRHDSTSSRQIIANIIDRFNRSIPNVQVIAATGPYDVTPAFQFPSDDARNVIFEDGIRDEKIASHYSITPRPGFRIVVINSGVCHVLNMWLIHNSTDPLGQLTWLAETLWQAEKYREKVHVVMSVSPADHMCLHSWGNEFHRIINRFENTVTGIFTGHSHRDRFHVLYDSEEIVHPIGVIYNAGSVSTFENMNRNYKVYYVDPNNWGVLDAESWVYKLGAANKCPKKAPKWYKLYSFRKKFNINTMFPDDMENFIDEMIRKPIFVQKYYRYTKKGTFRDEPCDVKCIEKVLFDVVTGASENKMPSKRIKSQFTNMVDLLEATKSKYQYLDGFIEM